MARRGALIVGLALLAAGGVYFLAVVGAATAGDRRLALIALAVVVLVYLMWTVDPAWLLTAGLISTMFAGNWNHLGLNFGFGPHRALLCAGLLALVLRAPPARDRPSLRFDRTHFAMAAALLYAVFSAFASNTFDEAEGRFTLLDQYGLLPFVMFTVAPVAFRTQRQQMILLGGLVGTGAYLSITALLEKLELYGLLVPQYIGDPYIGLHFGRARGPFLEAAANGFALYACAVAAAVALVAWRAPMARLLAAGVLGLASIGALVTVTRAVWLAAIAGTVVAVLTTPRLLRLAAPITAAAVVGVIGAFALIPGLAQDADRRQKDRTPVYERRNTTAAGLRMVADRPFFGHGWWFELREMDDYYRMHPDIPLMGRRAGFHNAYLLYAVALGLVGLMLWLAAAAVAFGSALSARAPPALVPWKVGLKALLVGWLVLAVFGPGNYAFATAVVWTWGGLLWRKPVVSDG